MVLFDVRLREFAIKIPVLALAPPFTFFSRIHFSFLSFFRVRLLVKLNAQRLLEKIGNIVDTFFFLLIIHDFVSSFLFQIAVNVERISSWHSTAINNDKCA